MICFADTSALYAVLDRTDHNHEGARTEWRNVLNEGARLVTHNYVVVESSALVQSRLGITALRAFHEQVLPLIATEWIDAARHHTALDMALLAGRKKLSLVDCASFLLMREMGISEAFCFDRHFCEQGFRVRPS